MDESSSHTSHALRAYAAFVEHFRWIDRGVLRVSNLVWLSAHEEVSVYGVVVVYLIVHRYSRHLTSGILWVLRWVRVRARVSDIVCCLNFFHPAHSLSMPQLLFEVPSTLSVLSLSQPLY